MDACKRYFYHVKTKNIAVKIQLKDIESPFETFMYKTEKAHKNNSENSINETDRIPVTNKKYRNNKIFTKMDLLSRKYRNTIQLT